MLSKKSLANPKYQQRLLEILFPILGYLFWDWTLIIIIIFYLLDLFSSNLMLNRRIYSAIKYQGSKYAFLFWLSILSSLIQFFVICFLSWRAILITNTKQDVFNELILFAKDELWFLLPVIILSYYMMDRMFYYMPRRFEKLDIKSYIIANLKAQLIALIFVVLGALCFVYIRLDNVLVILLIVAIKSVYDIFVKEKILKLNF